MRWHAEERIDDGVFRHLADSLAWKDFDEKNTIFSEDIRNVRLKLASDGFNPFRSMNIVHSTWPVILVPYNLQPLMCMKQPFIFLSVLIDGLKTPGDKIDVYLQSLIEELKKLFEDGVATFDSFSNEMFQMRAGLLWTINDFPAYANLSGWSIKGAYMCIRRWLEDDDKYRSNPMAFDGSTKYRLEPRSLSGVELLAQLESDGVLTEYMREDVDNLNSCRELQLMGIRSRYHLKTNEAGVEYVDPGDFEMNNKGKDLFFSGLSTSRMLEGAASNIARRQLCYVDNYVADLEAARARIVLTLCELEKIFPPSFFDVMEHLPIHLADEVLLAGCVIFRWMYPIESEHLVTIRRQYPSADEHFVKSVHFLYLYSVLSLQRRGVMLSEEIVVLSSFPTPSAKRFKSYKANGFLFRVKSIDNHRSTQNSGVTLLQADHSIKFDRFKFPLVNFKRLLYKNDRIGDEPFILASQAHQVWNAPDPSGQDWLNVVRMPARDLTHLQTKNSKDAGSSSVLDVDD
ncbi:hypothetical protein ACLB2K_066639 [Fragaria x ananassa]